MKEEKNIFSYGYYYRNYEKLIRISLSSFIAFLILLNYVFWKDPESFFAIKVYNMLGQLSNFMVLFNCIIAFFIIKSWGRMSEKIEEICIMSTDVKESAIKWFFIFNMKLEFGVFKCTIEDNDFIKYSHRYNPEKRISFGISGYWNYMKDNMCIKIFPKNSTFIERMLYWNKTYEVPIDINKIKSLKIDYTLNDREFVEHIIQGIFKEILYKIDKKSAQHLLKIAGIKDEKEFAKIE